MTQYLHEVLRRWDGENYANTSLFHALKTNGPSYVKALIEGGADLNKPQEITWNGRRAVFYPLEFAFLQFITMYENPIKSITLWENSFTILKLLIENGAKDETEEAPWQHILPLRCWVLLYCLRKRDQMPFSNKTIFF